MLGRGVTEFLRWAFIPGLVVLIVGVVWTHVGVRQSRAEALRGIRLRYLGLAMALGLPGAGIAFSGVIEGLDLGRILTGLILMAFGGLYLYARGGIGPQFPQA
jgi:hypothetical protein